MWASSLLPLPDSSVIRPPTKLSNWSGVRREQSDSKVRNQSHLFSRHGYLQQKENILFNDLLVS